MTQNKKHKHNGSNRPNLCLDSAVIKTQKLFSLYEGLMINNIQFKQDKGAQWLSGKVLDSRPRGRGFEPHRRHCVVALEEDTFILA